jgi:hypothetical protein
MHGRRVLTQRPPSDTIVGIVPRFRGAQKERGPRVIAQYARIPEAHTRGLAKRATAHTQDPRPDGHVLIRFRNIARAATGAIT